MEKLQKVNVRTPELTRVIYENGIRIIRPDIAERYKEEIASKDVEQRKLNFKKEHRIRCSVKEKFPIHILVAMIVIIVAALYATISSLSTLISIISVSTVISYIKIDTDKKLEAITWGEWKTVPFKDGMGYEGTALQDLCACYNKNRSKCLNPNILFEMEWHKASKLRFLVAYHRDEPETRFYLDCWEESGPQ